MGGARDGADLVGSLHHVAEDPGNRERQKVKAPRGDDDLGTVQLAFLFESERVSSPG